MHQVNIHAAKTNLSSLIDDLPMNGPFVIAKSGKPKAIVTPFEQESVPRVGFLKGSYLIPDDFDHILQEEIESMYYGELV